MVWIERLDYNWLSGTIGARVNRRRVSRKGVVPLSASVLHASVLPASARPQGVVSLQLGSDPGLFNCYDPTGVRAYSVPHTSQLTLKGSKGPTQKQLREAVSLQDSQQGLFGGLKALTKEFPELEQTRKDLALSLVMSRASSTFGKYLPLTRNWEMYAAGFRSPAYPATSELFVLYLQKLKTMATQKGTKGSAVSDTVYAVDFAHKLRGLDRPGAAEIVQLLIGSTKRALGRPVTKKTAILKTEVTAMLDCAILISRN